MKSISVIIPAYNEGSVIVDTIVAVDTYCQQTFQDYEIIVVNDGSTDQTASKVILMTNDRIKLVENDRNRGKGFSVRHGVEVAEKEWLLLCDADMSTPIGECDKLLEYVADYDIVIGSRKSIGGSVKKAQPKWKEWLGSMGNHVIRIILQLPYKDTQCGFKLMHNRIQLLGEKLIIDRWGFDFELLYAAHKNQMNVKEVGVVWINNLDTKVKPIDYIKTLLEVFMVRLHGLTGHYKISL